MRKKPTRKHGTPEGTAIQALENRKLNQRAPISRLSPELFSTIFCHVRDDILRPAPSTWCWRRTTDWIGVTHVCHAWRDIAINTPTLWAEIFISTEDRLEWVQEMLHRSKQCPLSILISKSALSSKAVGPLKNNMHRFCELRLLNVSIDDLHNFFSNSQTHRLEYLEILPSSSDTDSCDFSEHSSDSSDTDSSDFTDTSFDNPSDTSPFDNSSDTSSDNPSVASFILSDTVLPVNSLRHLSIDSCGLDFHAAFLSSLTHLELLNIDDGCRLPCTEFVAILAAMPGLERLKLEGFLKEDEVEHAEAYVAMTSKTHLHLKYLNLSCQILGEMVQFLCTLILPFSCKLQLHISDQGPEIAPGFPLIASWLSRHFQSAPPFRSFEVHFRSWGVENTSYVTSDLRVNGYYDLELEGSHIEKQFDKALLSASFLLCHDSESNPEVDLVNNSWRSFLKSLPLSNVVSLQVMDDSVALPDSIWVEIFAPLTSLKTIIINSEHYATFFNIASPDSSSSIALPFPALSSVIVKAHCDEHYLSIANSLDSRREAGLAPFNLVFHTDNMKPYAITRLRKSALSVQIHPPVTSTVI